METPERLARLETMLTEVRDDIREAKVEELRTRTRLHNLEGLTGSLVAEQRQRHKDNKTRDRRLELRLQTLTFAVFLATVAIPLVIAYVHHS